ncbi:MAG: hypothetical protein D6704_11165 [Nitrospirae bacterium]|nr:MAG: hypothetical protein D6704_11165 [Nitrospirota bacterium]
MLQWTLHHNWLRSVGLSLVLGVMLSALDQGMGAGGELSPSTTITAQTMIAQGKDRKAIFEGNVVLKQGDLLVRSDKMVVFFKASDRTEEHEQTEANGVGQQVDRIKATGRVLIKKATAKATCGLAIYYKDEEKIVLTKSPVAWQRGTRVSGTKMTMYLKEDRSVVEGGSQVLIMEQGGKS